MAQKFRKGSIGSIIDELEISLKDFKKTLKKVSEEDFVKIVDGKTRNPSCRSIATITDHVIRCGYFYPTMILKHKFPKEKISFPKETNLSKKADYIKALGKMFTYNEECMKNIKEREMLQPNPLKQIKTGWGTYDYEQILEHGIVHVYRHRRQVQKFIQKLKQA